MTLAEKTKNIINNKCMSCFSLYAGYGMNGGEYVRFPHGVQLQEKRNSKGRVIKAVYKYADDSILSYSYSEITENFKLATKRG